MKTTYLFTACITSLILIQPSEAQFLKKLKKRVEQKVENTIVEKTANKAAEKTSRSMDKVFDTNPFGGAGKLEKGDPSLVADAYEFTWKYSLKMIMKQGDIVFDYYLKPGASYFGFTSASMENMFTVMDNGNKVTTMFMHNEGNSMGMVSKMPDDLDLEETKDTSEGFTFSPLPDRTIRGYLCKGVNAKNEDYEMDMYFTHEAPISFDDVYDNPQSKIPPKLKDYFGKEEKMLMIYMDMRGLKDKKQNIQMECIAVEEVVKVIRKSDYKFM